MGKTEEAKNNEKYNVAILEGKKYSKSNALVNAKGKTSLLAQKLIAVGIQQAEKDENGRLVSTLYGPDLRNIFGKKGGSFYQQIKDLVEPVKGEPSFMDYRVVYTDDTTKTVEAYNVVTDCKFDNGVFTIKFNDSIADQIYELKSNYTVYSLAETIPLKSIYSFRLYEMLKAEYDLQNHRMKKMGLQPDEDKPFILEINLTDLKLRLGIIDPNTNKEILKAVKQSAPDYDAIEEMAKGQEENMKYGKYSNFKRVALLRAQKELSEKTQLSFEFEEMKGGVGGKIRGVRFYIKFKKKNKAPVKPIKKVFTEEEKENVIDELNSLIDERLKIKDLKAIAEAAEYDIEKVKKQYGMIKKKRTSIDDITAYLIAAVKNDYEEPVSRRGKKADFEQNEYDFDDLEDKLLDN